MFRIHGIKRAAACAVMLFPTLSFADPGPEEYTWYFLSGKTLLAACDAYLDIRANPNKDQLAAYFFDAGKCSGVVSATADILGLHKDALTGGWLPEACIPDDEQLQPLIEVVASYGRDHPEFDKVNAQTVVRYALAEKYPCPPRPAGTCNGNEESCG